MKKIIFVAVGFIACQCLTIWLLSGSQVDLSTDEVDMEIYGFEHEGHEYMMFEENGHTIGVIHNPDCSFCNGK